MNHVVIADAAGSMFSPQDAQNAPVHLSKLQTCEVLLLEVAPSVGAQELVQCRVFIGTCEGVTTIKNCADCIFTVACKQLRVQDCDRCSFYLHTTTVPAIARCRNLAFANFNGSFPNLESQLSMALVR